MLLHPQDRTKLDSSDDRQFYAFPRFVTHVDEGFIQQLTDLYRDRLQPQTRILDLMSSWVSHLPDEIAFEHVEGHGLNEEELAKNRRLDHYWVQDLNQTLQLPFEDRTFDAVLNCVSIQYLQYPDAIFSEIHRILKPGGVLIVSFSNRMFYQKAIQIWRDGTDQTRLKLVKQYIQAVSGFTAPELIVRLPKVPALLQLMGWGGGDPFYAAISYRQD
ncbi:class I SAM-dependent methyltransferase [Roseofilum sp. BLCC_M154]|uniref:Class I SAM-dependent methyltransferase n=1 Tax=Roseofilum acuticapitatum BLCC-M154 TaxID=3022444 RepID=A0ABT7AP71_9CYAN|nr:class I SAM-dependent methyltransferase [Roseofilum acuticapitatum]MDJ1168691.1 class I SAM-dependent methyltransferase [Roseofilum acuticapitatum BLCC-M154]